VVIGWADASRIDLGKATQLSLTRVSLPLSQPKAEKVLKFARCPHSLTSTVRGFAFYVAHPIRYILFLFRFQLCFVLAPSGCSCLECGNHAAEKKFVG
jgi:hypothetical protein